MKAAVRSAVTQSPILSEQFYRGKYTFRALAGDGGLDGDAPEPAPFDAERYDRALAELEAALRDHQSRYLEYTVKRSVLTEFAKDLPLTHSADDVQELEIALVDEESQYRGDKHAFEATQDGTGELVKNLLRNYRRIEAKLLNTPKVMEMSYDLEPDLSAVHTVKTENDKMENAVKEAEQGIDEETTVLQSLNEELQQLETDIADASWQVDELEGAIHASKEQMDAYTTS